MMVGNPHRYRAALQQLENRHATAGCLLALLFLIPLAARLYSMVTLLLLVLVYVTLVVPMATGFYTAGSLFARIRNVAVVTWDTENIYHSARNALAFIVCMHRLYMRLDSIHTTTNQTRHWSQLLHENSTTDFIKLTTAFIIVRLGKGMAMSMVLLTFTLQFNHLEPTYSYVALTLVYFILSQYKGTAGEETFIVSAVRNLGFQVLEGFEEFWVPLVIYSSTVALSATLVLAAIWQLNYWILCIIVGYANVCACGLQVLDKYWSPLAAQRAVIAPFPLATLQQMTERGDTACPVCLDDMHLFAARITPCSHIFHGQCLRKCIIQFGQCPLCKQPL
ncbi:hypothetical protein B7P43_G16443 [Cryptotermes secundus]|uniref:RING-type domain-containing protein n=2 Tax=Cryptotermes secundus TaxID=105785 RepID=A0A2J7QH91_9NEOP|nr:hypothetical protein B7P43_G16443 [Cryptotermes secundus]